MNLLITICGRAGSKGVKNKNFREFIGKPLVLYTISAALLYQETYQHGQVDLCVSSDSHELLKFAGRFDLTCISRPKELASDTSSKLSVIRHAAEYMENDQGKRYDLILDLDITSPLRTVEDIEKAVDKIIKSPKADVVFSVVPSRRNPYFNMVEIKDGDVGRIIDSHYTSRQQAPQVYDMNASIYCYRRDSLKEKLKQSPLDGVFEVILMKDTAILDIDSEEDFDLMEFLADRVFYYDFKEVMDYADQLITQPSTVTK